jgi:alanine-glyoxylate transaminase/serine-glyoxylate transaminase/serine-pyruvate transaminase
MSTRPAGRHFCRSLAPRTGRPRVARDSEADHRPSRAGADLGEQVLHGLRHVFRTSQPVIVYPASGTGSGKRHW